MSRKNDSRMFDVSSELHIVTVQFQVAAVVTSWNSFVTEIDASRMWRRKVLVLPKFKLG
jgi:hypothetical protein